MKDWTVSEVAAKLGLERQNAYDLMRVLVSLRLAVKKAGVVRRAPGNKSKGEDVYVISDDAGDQLKALLKALLNLVDTPA